MGLAAPWPVGSSQTRGPTMSAALAGGFFTAESLGRPYHSSLCCTVKVLTANTRAPVCGIT